MKKYFGMRVLMAIPTILGVFLAVFLIIRMVPGDPASVMLGKTATPEEISLPNRLKTATVFLLMREPPPAVLSNLSKIRKSLP